MGITVVRDAIGVNVSHLPRGQVAGYTTGSGGVPWSAAQFAAHPGAVRIDQDPPASDVHADVLDVESGAATNAVAARWYRAASASFDAGTRPGQRSPAIYTSAGNLTALVNALTGSGVHSGPGLWVANWSLTPADATNMIEAAGGPFPVIGVQFTSGQFYDTSIFDSTWLAHTSLPPAPKPPASPVQVEANGRLSWRELAHAHGTTVARSLWLTATHEPGGFGQPRQAAYIAAGDWNAPLPGPSGSTPGVKIWVG
jgi:hypothetical protein